MQPAALVHAFAGCCHVVLTMIVCIPLELRGEICAFSLQLLQSSVFLPQQEKNKDFGQFDEELENFLLVLILIGLFKFFLYSNLLLLHPLLYLRELNFLTSDKIEHR